MIVYVEFSQMNPKGWDKASIIMMMIYVKITICSTGCRSWGVRYKTTHNSFSCFPVHLESTALRTSCLL